MHRPKTNGRFRLPRRDVPSPFFPQRALKDYLNQEFGDLIQVNEQRDRVITGNFEVTIVNANGVKVIHSKKRGMGYASTAQSRQAIVEQIKAALEAK